MERNYKTLESVFIVLFIVISLGLVGFLGEGITGFVIGLSGSFSDDINSSFSSNSNYIWTPLHSGDIGLIQINGYLEGDYASIKLNNEEIYSYNPIKSDAIVVDAGSGEIDLSFDYGDLPYDFDNNGYVNIKDVIDFSINATFNTELDNSKLCTKYKINNLDSGFDDSVCFGSVECCSFLGLDASGNWNDAFYLNYGRYNAGFNNTVTAQVVYTDINMTVPYAKVYNSEAKQLIADFSDKIYFNATKEVLNYTDYEFGIDLNGILHVDSVDYYLKDNALSIMQSSNANASLNIYWDMNNETIPYIFHRVFFNAQFNISSNQTSINNALCNISYSDGVSANMTYYLLPKVYTYIRNFSSAGNYSYTVFCSSSIYGVLNETKNITVILPKAEFNPINLASAGQKTSLVWADYDNDNDWDLVYTGSTGKQIYRNDNGVLNSDSNYSFNSVQDGSMGFADFDNDGDLDFAVNGNGGGRSSKVYNNNGTGLNNIQNLTGIDSSSLNLFDFNHDGKIDLAQLGRESTLSRKFTFYKNNNSFVLTNEYTGMNRGSINSLLNNPIGSILLTGTTSTDSSGALTKTYNTNNFTLTEAQTLTKRYYSTTAVADFDNDGDLDIVIGGSYTSDGDFLTNVYKWDGAQFIEDQNLTGFFKGSMTIGDINNDGFIDLIITGANDSVTYNKITTVYLNNGTKFNDDGNYSLEGVYESSITLFDYDNDGDLDLAISGNNIAKVYQNNISNINANKAPDSPTSFDNSFNNGQLILSWNEGSDDLTPETGLYYNLRVSTTPYGNNIVSGKYGGSSNPTQGYLGNMMQEKTYNLNVKEDRAYYWQVQTIDNGLKTSAWSQLQEYSPTSCNVPNGDWIVNSSCTKTNQIVYINGSINITGSLSLVNTTIIMNNNDNSKGIYLYNGILNISNSTIKSNNINKFYFYINQSTIFDMDGSSLKNSFGLTVNTSNINLKDNTITNNMFGIKLYGSNITIKDSVIDNNTVDIFNSDGNNNVLINVSFSNKNITSGNLFVKHYLEVNVGNISGSKLSDVNVKGYSNNLTLVNLGITNNQGYARLELIDYEANPSIVIYNNYTINFAKTLFNQENIIIAIDANKVLNVNLSHSNNPIFDGFDSELTTNFNNVIDVTNVSDAKIGKLNLGQIRFLEPIDVSNLNLTDKIRILHNHISVNVSSALGINKKANITFFDLNYQFSPVILKNNLICLNCDIISYDGENLTFNVTGFSIYSSTTNSKLELSYTNKINQRPILNQRVFFYANYTNRTSGNPISGSNVNCSIDFGIGWIDMTFDNSLFVYQYNKTFNNIGNYNYNVICNGSLLDYELVNISNSIQIKPNSTIFELDNQNIEGTSWDSSSIIVGDLNNDNFNDFIISGQLDTSTQNAITYWYNNNQSVFNLEHNGLFYNFTRASLSLNDYDKDGDLDIFISGFDKNTQRFLIIKND